jgi:DNA helicase MCM9
MNKRNMNPMPPEKEANVCRDYQEIKVQEQVSKLNIGAIPRSILVVLEDDLAGVCKAGDDVSIRYALHFGYPWLLTQRGLSSGTVIRRWKSVFPGSKCELEITLLANNVITHNEQKVGLLVTEERIMDFEKFWEEHKDKPLLGMCILQAPVDVATHRKQVETTSLPLFAPKYTVSSPLNSQ